MPVSYTHLHNRNSRHNRACSFLGTIPALDIHKRTTGNRARLHQTFTDFLGIHVFNALRNYVGVSSRLRHLLGTGSPHNNRRLRHKLSLIHIFVLLEDMKDGILYAKILLKLYVKALKNGGKLQLDEHIPYTAQMLSLIHI